MYQVYLSLGTNLGNRKRNIHEVIEKIGEQIGVVECQSALYETKPWGYSSPNDYINACVLVLTTMAPRQVLEATQRIEREMGRQHYPREQKWCRPHRDPRPETPVGRPRNRSGQGTRHRSYREGAG